MIRTLQKKFILTAMAAVSILLLLFLGAVNIGNYMISEQETEKTLTMISDNKGDVNNVRPSSSDAPPDAPSDNDFHGMPKNEYDTFMSSNFFVIRFDDTGNIIYTDVSRTSSISEDDAKALAQEIYNSGSTQGTSGIYRYRSNSSINGQGTSLVFLDTSGEKVSMLRVLALSIGIGLLCWLLMLLFVILLSKRAIRPIAENIERQKQFVTNAGHEIKTPLAIIQSNTEAMELYNGENKWSRNIKEQTQRLTGLMQNLLLLARMDEGAAAGKPSDFSLNELVEQTMEGFVVSLDMKQIALKREIQSVTVHADRQQISQLLSILMDNALKYTNETGELFVSLQAQAKTCQLCLENTCDTLSSQEDPKKLFDRFYRSDTARTQKSGGYGIGLSVARSIAQANHGSISAAYLSPTRIRFTVTLPLAEQKHSK